MEAYTSTTGPPEAPPGLSPRGRDFWEATVARVELRIPDETTVLHELCRVLGVIDRLGAELATADSLEVRGSQGQPVVHWAVAEQRTQRGLLVSLVKALGLPPEEPVLSDQDEAHAARARTDLARHAARARWDKQRSG